MCYSLRFTHTQLTFFAFGIYTFFGGEGIALKLFLMCVLQLITNQTPRFSIGDCAAGHRADNRDKNRNVLIVPREKQFCHFCV